MGQNKTYIDDYGEPREHTLSYRTPDLTAKFGFGGVVPEPCPRAPCIAIEKISLLKATTLQGG